MGKRTESRCHLPDGMSAAAEAKTKATRSILEWAGVRLPVHHADQDEPVDPVESVGFSAIRDSAAGEPIECLGFACNMPSYVCDVCKFFKGEEVLEAFIEIGGMLSMGSMEMRLPVEPAFQSWRDARHDLYSSASTSRGARASIELRLAGRMNIF